MPKSWIFKVLEFNTFIGVLIHSYNCLSTVKMELAINVNYMTLSCFVTGRDIRKNIYLHCPLIAEHLTCRENCMKQCPDDQCPMDTLIDCRDRGLDTESDIYQIDYVIDASKSANHGKWLCQYGGISSSVIFVNASTVQTASPSEESIVTSTSLTPIIVKSKSPVKRTTTPSTTNVSLLKKSSISPDDVTGYLEYDKLLTKSEFIIAVIGFLVVSVIFNVYFCCRIAFVKCRSKEKTNKRSKGTSTSHNNPTYNPTNSQISDQERIYEDTAINSNHLPLLANIQNLNGNYMLPNYVVPLTCYSNLRAQTANNSSLPYTGMNTNGRSQHSNIPTVPAHMQSNYFTNNSPRDSDYSNIASISRDLSASEHPIMGNGYLTHSINPSMPILYRYGQVNSAPIQSFATMSKSSVPLSVVPESSTLPNSYFNYRYQEGAGKTRYERSRAMMEEADNLLRTADTLLKATDN